MIHNKALRELLDSLKQYKFDLVVVFAALITVSTSLLAIGHVFRHLVDYGLYSSSVESLNKSIYTIITLIGLFAVGSFCRSYFINYVSEKICAKIKNETFNSLLQIDVVTFEELKVGDIITRLTADISLIRDLITNFLSFFVRNAVMLCGGIILMFMQSAKLASMVIFSIPILLIPLLMLSKIVRKLSRQVLDSQADISSSIEESFSGIRTIHAYNQQIRFGNDFSSKINEHLNKVGKRLRLRSLFFALAISCIALTIIFVIWIGSIDIINGQMSSGQMVSFIYYSIIVGMSSGGIAEVFSELQGPMAALERVFELKSIPQKTCNTSVTEVNSLDIKILPIKFLDVNFAYPSRPDILVLKNLNLTINKTGFYGIVGRSGSGKSTVLQVLLQFYHHQTGRITLADIDANKLDSGLLRQKIAYVAQDPFIFSGTIRSNIAFSSPNATFEEVTRAAKLCLVDEFTEQLPHGLDTEIGERGMRLSGGQKQRIALARSILYQPEILLLDEATSALDNDTETQVLENISQVMCNKTVISIAHRISSLEQADKIFVVDNGKVAAMGTHVNLLKSSELYKLLNEELKNSR